MTFPLQSALLQLATEVSQVKGEAEGECLGEGESEGEGVHHFCACTCTYPVESRQQSAGVEGSPQQKLTTALGPPATWAAWP